jgi:hypothetical protein
MAQAIAEDDEMCSLTPIPPMAVKIAIVKAPPQRYIVLLPV